MCDSMCIVIWTKIAAVMISMTILCPSWEEPPRHVNNFAVLRAIHMALAPIQLAYAIFIHKIWVLVL